MDILERVTNWQNAYWPHDMLGLSESHAVCEEIEDLVRDLAIELTRLRAERAELVEALQDLCRMVAAAEVSFSDAMAKMPGLSISALNARVLLARIGGGKP